MGSVLKGNLYASTRLSFAGDTSPAGRMEIYYDPLANTCKMLKMGIFLLLKSVGEKK